MINSNKTHIFYDNECTLCARFKNSLQYFCEGANYKFHGITHSETYQEFPFLEKQKLAQTIHILTNQGEWLTGSMAIQFLISECPRVENFKWLIQSQAGSKASEIFYQASDQIRKKLKSYCKECGK